MLRRAILHTQDSSKSLSKQENYSQFNVKDV